MHSGCCVAPAAQADSAEGSQGTLCFERGAAAADLPVTTTFLLFITLLKSKICVKEFHPHIILSISVQSVLILLCCLGQANGTVVL